MISRGGELAEALIAHPRWTDYREKGGLDPLGMQNSSIDLVSLQYDEVT
ncbi:hypothetical protein C8D77_101374 [Mesorhizobium loti]|uniref:Uncharacterized protein n=1 Tax=Rhizobium loti TaxID=381 RepID=A0A8E3B6T6_RHILI|nr:hypothetical protein C8D77_101374 [Mesorhizobium loti]